jgi:hypothetical protein
MPYTPPTQQDSRRKLLALPPLFDVSCYTVHQAWEEWKNTIKPMLEKNKQDKKFKIGDRNIKAISKNRHLPEYIEKMLDKKVEDAVAVHRILDQLENVKNDLELSLPQLREGMRMINQIRTSNIESLKLGGNTPILGTKCVIKNLYERLTLCGGGS